MLLIDTQDIRHHQEKQVAGWCTCSGNCRRVVFRNFLHRLDWIGKTQVSRCSIRSRVDSLAPSATAARDKLGCVQGLHLQAVGTWGTPLLQSGDVFRCVFGPLHLPFYNFGNPDEFRVRCLIVSYPCRRSRILDYCVHGKEIKDDWTPVH